MCGPGLAVEETQDRQVGMGMGRGVKIANNREMQPALVDRGQAVA